MFITISSPKFVELHILYSYLPAVNIAFNIDPLLFHSRLLDFPCHHDKDMALGHFPLSITYYSVYAGVGKSCLLLRFSDDSFTTSFITTIGCVCKTLKFVFLLFHSFCSFLKF
jgi:hypothetical protein